MTEVVLKFGAAKPYDKQRPLLDHPGSVVCCGGTKTGKTMITAVWALRRFLEYPEGSTLPNGRLADGRNAWYGPTYDVAKISYDRAVRMLQPAIEAGIVKATASPYPVIKGIGSLAGREWHFLTTDNPSMIYGKQWDSITVEEFTRHKPGAIDAVITTAHPKRAPMRLIGNKVNKTNDGHRLATLVESGQGREGWIYVDLTCYDARDAGLVTDEELAEVRRDYVRRGVAHIFARDWENRFDDAGQPFPSALVAGCVRKLTEADKREAATHALLIDAGGTENPAGLVVVRSWQSDGAARAHIIEARHFVGSLPELEQEIGALVERYGPTAITFDSYAPMLGQTIASKYPRAAKRVSSGDKVLQAGYESLHGMMDGGTLSIDPSCEDLITDLDYVTFTDRGIAFAYYERHFAKTDRLHNVHADSANALVQGWSAVVSAGATAVQAPIRSHGRASVARRDFR